VSAWIIAAAVGLTVAALSYLGRAGAATRAAPALAVLRAVATALLAALGLDAPAGRTSVARPIVALDASASWTRAGDTTAFTRALGAARAAARAVGADTLWLVGDSLRPAGGADPAARDQATRLRPAAERAAGAGRPLVVVTDGEADDGDAMRDAPRGSRVDVVAAARGRDAAVTSLDAPRVAAAADTVDVRVTVGADAAGAGAGTLAIDLGGRVVATAPVAAAPAFGERSVVARVPLAGASGSTLLRAVVATEGDRDARNDSAAVVVEVSSSPAAVFVSTAPDLDARAMLAVLRGTLALPARAYMRVAPGQWRVEGTLASVPEGDVLRAARAASLLVLHGDTALLGPPRQATRAALALVPTVAASAAAADQEEWYAAAAPPSPLAAALSGVAWDSLPPIDLDAGAPPGEWVGLEARRGRRGAPSPAVTGSEGTRRVVIVGASGFWRWRFRGGAAAEAFGGLWGSIFDWLAAGRGDQRAAVPAEGILRAAEPVRWRRGGPDSLVTVTLRRRGRGSGAARSNDTARVDTVMLRFTGGATVTESQALGAGLYDVTAPGGSSLLAVGPSRELLPRRPSLRSGAVGSTPAADRSPRLRELGWAYALAIALLCAEWLLRRRSGLR
jgi:hypothetical protein